MLLSKSDIALLQIFRWCPFIRKNDLFKLHGRTVFQNMFSCGYLRFHKDTPFLVLSAAGHKILDEYCPTCPSKRALPYKDFEIHRQKNLASIFLTMSFANIKTELLTVSDLEQLSSYYLRKCSEGGNQWGSSRIAGIAHLGNVLYGCHWVHSGVGKLNLADELRVFGNNTASLPTKGKAFIFAGNSYSDILGELEDGETSTGDKSVRYGEAYWNIPMPVHLLSCDITGAKQLRIMALPDYRKRLAIASFGSSLAPSIIEESDGTYESIPCVIGVDMDLKRIARVHDNAMNAGHKQIIIVALQEQNEKIFRKQYREKGSAKLMTITRSTMKYVLEHAPEAPVSLEAPYVTPKGGYLNAPTITVYRKI